MSLATGLRLTAPLLCTLAAANSAAAQWGFAQVSGPPATQGPLLCNDLQRAQCVLVCGSGTTQTWTYDGTWQQMATTQAPAGYRFAQLVNDIGRGVSVLYGGRGSNQTNGLALDATWEWNGTDWTQAQPLSTPGGIESYAAAYDLGRQRTVIYGGLRNSWVPQGNAQTWEYDGAQWLQVYTSSSPGQLELASACYSFATGTTILFGGRLLPGGTATDDTWAYDGVDWQLLPVTGSRPAPRVQANFVYDPLHNVCVLFGGLDPSGVGILNDTWAFDGTTWREIPGQVSGIHPPRAEGAMTIDSSRGRLVYFGGRTANTAVLDETWEYGAQVSLFGLGCAGSNGTPHLDAAQRPIFGTTFAVDLSNLPANPVAMLALGLSRTTWAFGALPTLLTSFGMPGCRAYTSSEVLQLVPVSAGLAQWTLPIPAQEQLLGVHLYMQGLAIDPGVNSAGLTVSNAVAAVIGF